MNICLDDYPLIEDLKRIALIHALKKFNGNRTKVCKYLGICNRSLRYWMRKWKDQINPPGKPPVLPEKIMTFKRTKYNFKSHFKTRGEAISKVKASPLWRFSDEIERKKILEEIFYVFPE